MRPSIFILITTAAVLLPQGARSNGLELQGPALDARLVLSAGISWENSWRYEAGQYAGNWDAAWVFCKGLNKQSGAWEHIPVREGADVLTPGMEALTAVDGTGVMVRRNGPSEGHVRDALLEIPLDIGSAEEYYEIRLFGIEMVFVPEGAFYAGDSASVNTLGEFPSGRPFLISGEGLIESGESDGMLWALEDMPPAGPVPASFPKGFVGFYCMKYEISQKQYADFLNTLSPIQRETNRLSTLIEAPCFSGDHLEGERNYIAEVNGLFGCDANENAILNESDDGGNVACNFLTWSNLVAYLDWSGLRPMTELEFEKSCRGPAYPKELEYAWGTAEAVNTITTEGLGWPYEHAPVEIGAGFGLANFGYCQPSGPLRCGFAAYNSTERAASGSSFYGIMEMSGNLWELCVPLDEDGLKFDGNHGNGGLDAQGRTDEANWSRGGHRGGGWNSGILPGFRDLAVSDRFFIYLDPDDQARGTAGGRGVISENRLP